MEGGGGVKDIERVVRRILKRGGISMDVRVEHAGVGLYRRVPMVFVSDSDNGSGRKTLHVITDDNDATLEYLFRSLEWRKILGGGEVVDVYVKGLKRVIAVYVPFRLGGE